MAILPGRPFNFHYETQDGTIFQNGHVFQCFKMVQHDVTKGYSLYT